MLLMMRFEWVFKLGQVKHDRGLITAFIERWRPETHTFHLPFGEATITLEDVHHILGLRTTGRPFILHGFTTTARERLAMIRDVLGLTPEAADVRKNCLRVGWLIDNFGDCARLDRQRRILMSRLSFTSGHTYCVLLDRCFLIAAGTM